MKVKNKATKVTKPTKTTKAAKPTKAAVTTKKSGGYAKGLGLKPVTETMSKSALLTHISTDSGVDLKMVKKVMASLENLILSSIMPGSVGEFTLSGIAKITTKAVPARKAGTLVRNPATGEMVKAAAKPASVRVKARVLSKPKKAAI